MPQAVTLAANIMQLIIGIQATVCTSLIAALLLERLAVPRSQAALASVMRGINDGPWRLVLLVLSSRSAWAKKASILLRHLEAWLIILVAVLSLALQFTSTILLTDMHALRMIGDRNASTVYGLSAYPGKKKFALFQGSLMVNAPVFPVFGEVLAGTTYNSTADTLGLSDTGLRQRGLLPISGSENRTSVRQYDGMGMVMNSRVACMRPVITNASLDTSMYDGEFGTMEGVLEYGQSLAQAQPSLSTRDQTWSSGSLCDSSRNCEQAAFSCIIPAALNSTEGWAAGACVVDGVGGSFRGPYSAAWNPDDGPWSQNSSVWLVYSTNMNDTQWGALPPDSPVPAGQSLAESEWTNYEIVPGHSIKMSVCFAGFNFEYRDISMSTPGATAEPSTPWSLVLNEGSNTDDVETYLGLDAARQAVTDRGILGLQIRESTPPYAPPPPFDELLDLPADEITPAALTVNSLQLEMNYELSDGNTQNTSFMLCSHCTVDGTPVHLEYAFLFSSILHGGSGDSSSAGSEEPGRAADALHALLTVAGLNVYDQFLIDSMDVAEEVQVVSTVDITVPGPRSSTTSLSSSGSAPSTVGCSGFIAVTVLLLVYLVVVAVITLLYIRHTRYSRYGNVWHVVSQLVAAEELGETLKVGNNAGDDVVEKELRAKMGTCEGDVLVKLGQCDGGESIKVVRYA